MSSPKEIYLDYAAATPVDKAVFAAMQPYFSDKFYNPSATYLSSRSVKSDLNAARAKVAHWLGVRPAEIIFTAGGTEANNLAIFGAVSQFSGGEIVSTAIEHESVLGPVRELEKLGHKVHLVAPKPNGVIEPSAIAGAVTDKTVLVSVMYANNEIGTIQPLRDIAQVIKSKVESRKSKGNTRPLYFHTDACQAGNYLNLQVHRLGVDLMTINGGKIYGPKQSGVLCALSHVQLSPIIFGGGQEKGLRSGTENVAGAIGLATALDLVQKHRASETARISKLQQIFFDLLASQIPMAQINGSTRLRLPNNIHVTLPGQDNERLMMELDERGIMCGLGSACSASSDEPSHVLKAIGLSDGQTQASLRFSMGRSTTEADVRQTIDTLSDLY